MGNNNDKYGGINRNLWRRVYPVGVRRQPATTNIISPDTGLSYSIDRQTTQRHRDYFKILTLQSGSQRATPSSLGQYDEGLINFNNETSVTFNYNITFAGSPIIVYTMETPASGANPLLTNTERVNPFGNWTGLSSASVGLSAPYSGTVRFRAVFNGSYPVNCTSAFTSSFTCFAGTTTPASTTNYTASYTTLATVPEVFLQSPIDSLDLRDADVFLSTSLTTATEANVEISAPLASPINFICFTNIVA